MSPEGQTRPELMKVVDRREVLGSWHCMTGCSSERLVDPKTLQEIPEGSHKAKASPIVVAAMKQHGSDTAMQDSRDLPKGSGSKSSDSLFRFLPLLLLPVVLLLRFTVLLLVLLLMLLSLSLW